MAKKLSGKRKEEFIYATGKSTVGNILVALSDFGIVSVLFHDSPTAMAQQLRERFPTKNVREDRKQVKAMLDKVVYFIDHPAAKLTLPLDMRGTEFQQRVWKAALAIPRGQSSTYSDIAKAINKPRAMRAVGTSCTNNHFSIIVPCHRVLHKGETLADQLNKGSKRRRALFARDVKIISKNP